MRLAASSTAERLISQDYAVLVVHAGFRDKEPLALPDRLAPLDLRRTQAVDGGSHVANAIAGHGRSKPVAFIAPKQELVLFVPIANHQQKMMHARLHVKNFGCYLSRVTNHKHLAGTVFAYIN